MSATFTSRFFKCKQIQIFLNINLKMKLTIPFPSLQTLRTDLKLPGDFMQVKLSWKKKKRNEDHSNMKWVSAHKMLNSYGYTEETTNRELQRSVRKCFGSSSWLWASRILNQMNISTALSSMAPSIMSITQSYSLFMKGLNMCKFAWQMTRLVISTNFNTRVNRWKPVTVHDFITF